jgi:hypothetical protein
MNDKCAIRLSRACSKRWGRLGQVMYFFKLSSISTLAWAGFKSYSKCKAQSILNSVRFFVAAAIRVQGLLFIHVQLLEKLAGCVLRTPHHR